MESDNKSHLQQGSVPVKNLTDIVGNHLRKTVNYQGSGVEVRGKNGLNLPSVLSDGLYAVNGLKA